MRLVGTVVLLFAALSVGLGQGVVSPRRPTLHHSGPHSRSMIDMMKPKHMHGMRPDAPACSAAQFQKSYTCWSAYLLHYGFDISRGAPTYLAFKTYESAFLEKNGLAGQHAICQWTADLQTCLGALDTQDTCQSVAALAQTLNASMSDADSWMTFHFILEYECGPGYNDLLANFACILTLDASQASAAPLLACDNALSQSNFTCPDFNTYITCKANAATQQCGSSVTAWMCGLAKREVQINTHSCDAQLISC